MKFSKTFALAGALSSSLILGGLTSTVAAHDDNDQGKGKSKHYFCYDKHGRWRQHPHCPPPQQTLPHGHYYTKEYYHSHDHDYRRSIDRQPQIIYVRKDGPFDPRSKSSPVVVRDSRNAVKDARQEVEQSRDQLRKDRTELKNDRAELRRDIRSGASKAEIKADRQEIRADVDKIKATRRDVRQDQADLGAARRDLARK